MKCFRYLTLLLICAFYSCATQQTVDVLIVTGINDKYHCCEKMTPFLESVLGEWQPFNTEIIDMRDYSVEEFSPRFNLYDVVILNFDSVEWSEQTKSNFVEYVKGGGGVVVVHEANNAFAQWPEYNEIIGFGGWAGRTKESGAYYYYLDGEYVLDAESDGASGSHGKRAPFMINVRDTEHPIVRGLPAEWIHLNDELYSNMRGPIGNMHPLATAYSDPETGGSGKEEIVLFTNQYGNGRIFHCVLGHTTKSYDLSLQNRGMQVVLSRGIEWAATGEVTQSLTFEPIDPSTVNVEWIKGQPLATIEEVE